MEKIRFFTFGCKVNQYDSQIFMELLSEQGYQITDENHYDIALINTCCVTKKAEKEAKRLIRKLVDTGKMVWITGCLVEKDDLVSIFSDARIIRRNIFYQQAESKGIDKIKTFHSHMRAFVKIVDGCENFCSYCIIPFVRGKISSRPISKIINEVKVLADNSYKEIVLAGIDLGSFGKDTGENLKDLVKQINEIKGLARFRLSSIEVFHLNEQLLDVLCLCDKFCPSFHVPLQSGSDRILKLMGRPYSFSDYKRKLEQIEARFKNITFTTDIMIGFPGETQSDFDLTLQAISDCKFLKVHIFPFSPHKQTKAASMPENVPDTVKKERLRKAMQFTERISADVKRSFIGKQCDVLVEAKLSDFWFGYSEHYIPVLIDSSEQLSGKILKICPKEIKSFGNTDYLFAKSSTLP